MDIKFDFIDETAEEVLIISDLHFDNYYFQNPAEDKRRRFITQPLKLADRINYLCMKKNIKHLFILGDCFNKSVSESRIITAVQRFFFELNKDVHKYVILGQHDISSKIFATPEHPENNFYYAEDTLMRIILEIPGINNHYCHNKYLKLGDRSFYMADWAGKTTIIEPKVPVDVFMSHVLLDFIDLKECLPLVDNYKVAIHGDIHMPKEYKINNTMIYSASVPYQHDLKCTTDGNIVCLNLKDLSIERIPTDTEEFQFLKFYAPVRNFTEDEEKKVIEITSSLQETIDKTVIDMNLEQVHAEVIEMKGMPEMIDFNFKIKNLHVENFKSIKELDMDFSSRGISYVCGKNGSGKSSLLEALKLALIGDTRTINQRTNNDDAKNKVALHVTLEYKGVTYEIRRGTDLLKFYIDGVEKSHNNKAAVNDIISETLPFLKYLDMFFVPANNHFFTLEKREQLIKVCFNLGIFDFLFESSKELKKVYNNKSNLLSGEVNATESSISLTKDEYNRLRDELDDVAVTYTKEELEELRKTHRRLDTSNTSLKDKIEDNHRKIAAEKMVISSLKSIETFDKDLYEKLTKEIENIDGQISAIYADKETTLLATQLHQQKSDATKKIQEKYDILVENRIKENSEELLEKAKDLKTFITKVTSEIAENNKSKVTVEYAGKDERKVNDSLIAERDSQGVCPTCGQNIPTRPDILALISESDKKLEDIKSKYLALSKQIKSDETLVKEKNQELEDMNAQYINISTQIKDEVKAELKRELADNDSKYEALISATEEVLEKQRVKVDELTVQKTALKTQVDAQAELKESAQKLITAEHTLKTLEADNAEDLKKSEELGTEIAKFTQSLQVSNLTECDTKLVDLLSEVSLREEKQKQLESTFARLQASTAELKKLKKTCSEAQDMYTKTCAYIDLFDPNRLDSIPYKVLNDITEVFKTGEGKLNMTTNYSTKTAGKEKFRISCNYDFGGKVPIDYDSASDGQKCVMDFEILKRLSEILGEIGLVILDESLSNLDDENYEKVLDNLTATLVDNVLISSFSHNFTNYDSLINVEIFKGVSQFTEGF